MSDDRDWQHPAEHAATNSHGFIMNPPPLAKRIVILTALISLLTSVAVLFVAIPKGIDEYVEAQDSTTTVPTVKGSVPNQLGTLTVGSVSSCAIEVAPGAWIASSDHIESARGGTIKTSLGEQMPVRFFRSPSVPYLVVGARVTGDIPTLAEFGNVVNHVSHLPQALVVDCISKQVMHLEKTPSQFADEDQVPVMVSGDINGVAAVLNENNSLMGLVCEHNHAQWFFDTQILFNLVTSAK